MDNVNPTALIPILVFVILYLGLGIILEYVLHVEVGFYSIPVFMVFLIAMVIVYKQIKGLQSNEKFSIMARCAGDPNVFLMILLFLTAGIFIGVMNRVVQRASRIS